MSDLNRIGAAVGVMAMLLFGSRGWADNPPGGSYKQTCQNIVAAGDTLRADCKDNGGTVHASPPLQAYSHCAGDISNQNAVLSCVPNGSYAATCIDVKLSGTTLAANCRPLIGTRLASTLPNINTCMSDILNFNGRLECSKGKATPGGSYLRTCSAAYVSGNTLFAICKDKNAVDTLSQLNLDRRCSGDIYNLDGLVTCVFGGPAPGGSYLQTCRDITVNGTNVSAFCKRKNGSWKQTSGNFNCGAAGLSNNDGQLTCAGAPSAGGPGAPIVPEKADVCCQSESRPGWIVVNRHRDFSKCSTGTSQSFPNVCTLERYDNLPVGTQLQVCASEGTPNGWEDVRDSAKFNPTLCQTNQSDSAPNVKAIRRLR